MLLPVEEFIMETVQALQIEFCSSSSDSAKEAELTEAPAKNEKETSVETEQMEARSIDEFEEEKSVETEQIKEGSTIISTNEGMEDEEKSSDLSAKKE